MSPPAALALLLVVVLFLLIPIVAILTEHQQKMVRLMREGRTEDGAGAEVRALREEIQELKALVHQQAIAADRGRAETPLQERVQA
jgi:hypothetical protein